LVAFGGNIIAYGEPKPPGAAFLPIKANHSAKNNYSISFRKYS